MTVDITLHVLSFRVCRLPAASSGGRFWPLWAVSEAGSNCAGLRAARLRQQREPTLSIAFRSWGGRAATVVSAVKAGQFEGQAEVH